MTDTMGRKLRDGHNLSVGDRFFIDYEKNIVYRVKRTTPATVEAEEELTGQNVLI